MNKIYKKIFSLATGLLMAGSIQAQMELVTDGGFENGPGAGSWIEASSNFGTPLCDLALCGTGTGTGPRTGTYWAWFGGIQATTETASVEQSFVIPAGGTVSLTFWLEQIVCDGPQDFMEVSIDGNIVFSTDGVSALCGVLGYSLQTVDISSYADGNSHTLSFNSTTFSANGNVTNFFIDDISVMSSTGSGNCPDILTDGDFELGPGGGAWTEASTNFGTPLCDLAGCGNGTGTGPNGGTYWAWFGGFTGGTETSSLTQSLIFPLGDSITLEFALEQFVCDGAQDFLEVTVDGNQVFLSDGVSPLCGVLGYSNQTIDLSSYADGNSHTVSFNSTTFSANGAVTNFFVDDVKILSCSNGGSGSSCNDTATFAGVNLAIPDGDTLGVTNSQVVAGITGTTLGADVELAGVCFKIDHTWVGDLTVTLVSPIGSQVVLLDRPGFPSTAFGCDGDNLDVCVETGTGNEMEGVCNNLPAISGSYTAANGLNLDLINDLGGPPNGTWQLIVSDAATPDLGTLIGWSLIVNTGPIADWTVPDTLCGNSAPINLDLLVTGQLGGTWAGTGVTGNTFDPTGLTGVFPVTYTVSDGTTGCTDAETNNIIVDQTPVAAFTSALISLTGNFISTSTAAVTYLWDFGDGTTSTDQNPTHTYAIAGTYTVTLTVTNACGTNSTTQTITVQGCPDVIVDGSFENGIGSGSWTEFSTNFGTPLCDLAGCGNGTGTGPRTGDIWSWFGGISAFEEASLVQTVTLATNSTANLTFWLEQIICDSPDDFLKIAIDADTVYTTNGSSALCGVLGYSLQTVNIDAYCDGNAHTITFLSRSYAINGGGTNFFVDDIAVNVCTSIGVAEANINQHVSIMPNPARDFFEIRFSDIVTQNVTIEVTDVVGKTVMLKNISSVNDDQSERVDISSWSKGVYMVKITAAGNSTMRKVVVQ
ncbi:MAG: PKD domain-containing protein [Bacteroidetes bacterium]|nr:PKD domain-containing protein [Bacteroidota bacterium]